jgi:hypothetical protein
VRAQQLLWRQNDGWHRHGSDADADLVLYFGARQSLSGGQRFDELRAMFPRARILGCSTGGQIHDDDVFDDDISALVIHFETTKLKATIGQVSSPEGSHACGEEIGRALLAPDLAGIFILSDGLNVNGSKLVAGLAAIVGHDIPVTGGLAGDGARFSETLVGADCAPKSRSVAALGFYGSAIRFGHGSAGGWDVFGPRRRISRSRGNVLYELDGESPLELYERYLGEEDAQGLPSTALLFPLQIYHPDRPQHNIVRTVHTIDRDARSMTFAGDVPEGWTAQLMRGNLDRLANAAGEAARQARVGASIDEGRAGVAILVSCIGRRVLMGQRTVEEVEAVGSALGSETLRIGFYSYGEICPHASSGFCELHNQTMTVTAMREIGEQSRCA